MIHPDWNGWAQRLQAIAQTGLTYATDEYDRDRFLQVQQIAVEIMAAHSSAPAQLLESIFARERGYATPKVDVRAAVFRDGQILLVREREDGGWTLPGGWADVGVSPARNAEREVREESGYEVRATRLLAVWDRNLYPHPPIAFHAYKLIFLCELIGGAAAPSNETSEVAFFAEDALPPLSVSRILSEQIAWIFEQARHPEQPVLFD